MPPITLNNRYKYNPDTDLLGEGGLGKVYKAYDVQQERYVAIKKFNAADSLKYSLRAEFQKSIHFSHGNLVRAYDFFSTYDTLSSGETHETQYGVMELIAGGDLAKYLSTQPPLPELLAVTKGILHGLNYLHTPDPKTDKGIIIHRDIKPANILVFRNNQGKPIPKITDFNIAKDATNEVSTQTAIGTPEYMSPEQYLPPKYGTNGRVMPNADLWALGLLLCDHLLNRSLFGRRNNGQTKGEITHNILSETLPTAEIRKLPAPFNQIVAQCLIHYAPQRVQSAKELLAMIDRYENSVEDTIKVVPPKNKPTPKTYVPKIEDTFKPAARKNNTSTIVLVVMLFCWMLGLGYLLYPTTPPTPSPIDTTTRKEPTNIDVAPPIVSGEVDAAGEATSAGWAALGKLMKRKLADGTELNVPEKGVENKLISFIEDKTKMVDKTTWFSFDRLLFETGKSTLKPESAEQVKNMAAILKAFPQVEIKLGGYTDNTGDAKKNLALSGERAKTVKAELVKLGADARRIATEGYGQEHPVADNATPAGREQNRRIDVHVTKK